MNFEVKNQFVVEELRTLIHDAVAEEWQDKYNEPFSTNWGLVSVNIVGDKFLDVFFAWRPDRS